MKDALRNRDVLGGVLLIVIGLCAWGYASTALPFGSLQRMGAGFFPSILGLLLAAFGLAIVVSSWRSAVRLPEVEWRPVLAVTTATLAFAMLVRATGLLPAIVAMLVLSRLATARFHLRSLIVMAVALPLAAYLVFGVALQLPLPLIRSPW